MLQISKMQGYEVGLTPYPELHEHYGKKVELEKAKNEVQRKIGRNVLLFQQVEYLLKYVVANGNFSGSISQLWAKKERQIEVTKKQTLGGLVGQYLESTHSECEEVKEDPVDLEEAHISFAFRLDVDAVYYETKKEELESLVAERNDLIHHLLPRLNLESIESWLETEEYLDQQREKLIPELNLLQSIAGKLKEAQKELSEDLKSGEVMRQFKLLSLRQGRLPLLLGEIANQIARRDGWTVMDTAAQLVRQHAPEEMVGLKKKHGYKTLKELMVATELFDMSEESTERGGVRVLYRLKPEWKLQNS